MQTFDPQTYRDNLRKYGVELATGERDKLLLRDSLLDSCSDPDFASKITKSYLRNTLMRIPEIRDAGTISITRNHDEDWPGFLVTFNRGKFTKGYRRNESNAIRQAENKLIDRILAMSPALEDCSTDEIAISVEAIKRYKAIIEGMKHED